jgi:peptide chain release factor 2
MKIVIGKKDLRRDTFHCGGPGGQNVNKVETGVRYTHIPTSITAASCAERTQGKNQELALKVLLAKLKAHYEEERRGKEVVAKDPPSFGHQVRSYILHGQQRVIDHRTGVSHPSPRDDLISWRSALHSGVV